MKALTFRVRTKQPLLIPAYRPGDENSASSLNYIPGTILRGMFIQHYTLSNKTPNAADPEFRQLFLDGHVRFLNAYPAVKQKQRSLPTPLSWRAEKNDRGKKKFDIYDFAMEWDDNLERPATITKKFCFIDDEGDVQFVEPSRVMRYHNASQKRMKKIAGSSTVFRYEAIAPDETFVAAVIGQENTLLKLQKLIEPPKKGFLGKSRRAGYGLVELSDITITDDWHEYTPADNESEDLIITLLSDAILRDPDTGQWTTDLGRVLDVEIEEAFFASTTIGGINAKWGLPLPQMLALRAGSVFRINADALSDDRLEQLLNDGIGERRVEGFGRIAVQWQGRERYTTFTPSSQRSRAQNISLENDKRSQKQLKRMAKRLLRHELDQRLLEALHGLKITGSISNSQLSRLRLVVRRAQEQQSWQPMSEFLSDDNLKATARRQLERAHVGKHRLLSWLRDGVEINEDESIISWPIWNDYIAKGADPTIKFGDAVEVLPTNEIKLEYTLRLIDALLHKTSREGGEA